MKVREDVKRILKIVIGCTLMMLAAKLILYVLHHA
jgi:hypothetical protein